MARPPSLLLFAAPEERALAVQKAELSEQRSERRKAKAAVRAKRQTGWQWAEQGAKPLEERRQEIASWPQHEGYWLLVKPDPLRGDVWARTSDEDTAASLLPSGFLQSNWDLASRTHRRLADVPLYGPHKAAALAPRATTGRPEPTPGFNQRMSFAFTQDSTGRPIAYYWSVPTGSWHRTGYEPAKRAVAQGQADEQRYVPQAATAAPEPVPSPTTKPEPIAWTKAPAAEPETWGVLVDASTGAKLAPATRQILFDAWKRQAERFARSTVLKSFHKHMTTNVALGAFELAGRRVRLEAVPRQSEEQAIEAAYAEEPAPVAEPAKEPSHEHLADIPIYGPHKAAALAPRATTGRPEPTPKPETWGVLVNASTGSRLAPATRQILFDAWKRQAERFSRSVAVNVGLGAFELAGRRVRLEAVPRESEEQAIEDAYAEEPRPVAEPEKEPSQEPSSQEQCRAAEQIGREVGARGHNFDNAIHLYWERFRHSAEGEPARCLRSGWDRGNRDYQIQDKARQEAELRSVQQKIAKMARKAGGEEREPEAPPVPAAAAAAEEPSERHLSKFPPNTKIGDPDGMLFSIWDGNLALITTARPGRYGSGIEYLDPERMERKYSVRPAVTVSRPRRPIEARQDDLGGKPVFLEPSKPYEETTWTLGSSFREYGKGQIGGTFGPVQTYWVRVELGELHEREGIELVSWWQKQPGIYDARTDRCKLSAADWRKAFALPSFAATQELGLDKANAFDCFMRLYPTLGYDADEERAWRQVEAVFAETKKGQPKWFVRRAEPKPLRRGTFMERIIASTPSLRIVQKEPSPPPVAPLEPVGQEPIEPAASAAEPAPAPAAKTARKRVPGKRRYIVLSKGGSANRWFRSLAEAKHSAQSSAKYFHDVRILDDTGELVEQYTPAATEQKPAPMVAPVEPLGPQPGSPMSQQQAHDWLIEHGYLPEGGSSRYRRPGWIGRIEDKGQRWTVTEEAEPSEASVLPSQPAIEPSSSVAPAVKPIRWQRSGKGGAIGHRDPVELPSGHMKLAETFTIDNRLGMWRVRWGEGSAFPVTDIGSRSTLARAKELAQKFEGGYEAAAKAMAEAAAEAALRSTYSAKKEAKAERMRLRAERKRSEAASLESTNKSLSDVMMGTPVLVGHHSEKRHRKDLERMHSRTAKAYGLQKEAASLEHRAATVEGSRAIDSDDPDALEKLKGKLESIRKTADQMARYNSLIARTRRDLSDEELDRARQRLEAAGVSSELIDKLLTADTSFGRRDYGFPDYAISNRRAEIRRLEKRIADLGARAETEGKAKTLGDVRIVEEDNRLRIYFPAKPAAEVRTQLKRSGFRWSPQAGAWQRKPSTQAWYQAERIVGPRSTAPATQQPTPLQVRLSAVGDPDRDQPVDLGIEPRWVDVGSYEEASRICRDFLTQHGFGSGNWDGGQIRRGRDIVARVSYNGRVWEGQRCVYDC